MTARDAFLSMFVAKLNADPLFRDTFRAAIRERTGPGVQRAEAMNQPEAGLASLFPTETTE